MAEPTQLRRQLGAELRGVRTLAGLSQRELAGQIEPSQATIVRVERGDALLSQSEAQRWLAACLASEDIRERVLALTAAAHSETWRWEDPLDAEGGHLQGIAAEREEAASLRRGYTLTWMPGLLQTAEYARLLMPQADPTGVMDHAKAVARRMERQQLLYKPGRRFEFLIEENALHWSPGPNVMRAQLDRLVSMATLETVTLALLRADRVGAPGWHGFVMYTPVDGGPVKVATELRHGGQWVVEPDLVARYESLWAELWAVALVDGDAVEFIRTFTASGGSGP